MKNLNNPTIILGGGFAGLFAALHLSASNYPEPIILIDCDERFTFKPLLYELLSEEMSESQVCPRFSELLSGRHITFVCDRAEKIDLHRRRLELASGLNYSYKNLVLGVGSAVNYFGVEGAKENAMPFRSGEDASKLRTHLRNCLQRASQMEDTAERRRLLTVAMVGAGPAGVELAATLGDLLPKWYSGLGGDPEDIRLVVLELSSNMLVGDINDLVREVAKKALQERTVPVDLRFERKVTRVGGDEVEFKDKSDKVETLPAATTIWTGGVKTHPLIKALEVPEEKRDRQGRLLVAPTLQLLDFPEVFAGGDCCAQQHESLPPLAQVAYQQGAAIATNLKALARNEELMPAEVKLRGSLLKLGLGESAASLFHRFEISGLPGHLIREGTYLELLPTPIHNLKVTAEWLIDEIFLSHTS